MMNLKKCQICGERPSFGPCKIKEGMWVLSHYCNIDDEGPTNVTVYGSTPGSCLDKWGYEDPGKEA